MPARAPRAATALLARGPGLGAMETVVWLPACAATDLADAGKLRCVAEATSIRGRSSGASEGVGDRVDHGTTGRAPGRAGPWPGIEPSAPQSRAVSAIDDSRGSSDAVGGSDSAPHVTSSAIQRVVAEPPRHQPRWRRRHHHPQSGYPLLARSECVVVAHRPGYPSLGHVPTPRPRMRERTKAMNGTHSSCVGGWSRPADGLWRRPIFERSRYYRECEKKMRREGATRMR